MHLHTSQEDHTDFVEYEFWIWFCSLSHNIEAAAAHIEENKS